ncbi:hypothetical protein [uncultured Microbacterium sp.]|uniref:Uncharacterized protein n=1 Tax=uncultured Microbacterium sp. TaxID=191216 RepID=A0A1Y5P4P7_9MICO|nr:hypothetical protein [uncultured Microbacterium sp.]SBS73674.1 membrane hypothetical protein [uncultured Microbacterium sp.]
MSFRHASAREWAQEHSLAAPVRLGLLEVMAFQRHPDIYGLFGADGAVLAARETARRPSPARRAGTALAVILAVVGAAAPVVAVAAMGGDRFNFFRMDAAASVPFAGAMFVLAAVAQLVLLVGWLRGGARYDGLLLGIVLVAVVFSGFAAVGMPNTAATDGFDGWAPWYPPVLACLVIAVVTAIAMLLRFRARVPETVAEAPETMSSTVAVARIRAKTAALRHEERAAITADRDAALVVLHERGVIEAGLLERARTAQPGTLFTLDDET